jgi:hypothetical protein
MKALNCLLICLITLAFNPASGQQPPAPPAANPLKNDAKAAPSDASGLTRFNLDFPGGTPKELVAAIQKALGKPLNAVVPDEFAEVKLPPLKMTNIHVADLFNTLIWASKERVAYYTSTSYGGFGGPSSNYQNYTTAYGFKTESTPTDDSIWYFFEDKPAVPPFAESPPSRICRFYLLTPYLERRLTVDDITTAIQTGWKMLGDKETPSISFHKETKLLIAVGEPRKLETIDAVLKALEPPKVSAPAQAPAKAKPATETKADE